MNKSDWPNFCEIMNVAAEITNCGKKSENALSFIFNMLKGYEFTTVANALKKHLEESNFFPTPADFHKHISGTDENRCGISFHKMLQAVAKYGRYSSVQFGDPKIHYCIKRLGGWQRVCNVKTEDHKWLEIEFKKAYEEAGCMGISWGHSEIMHTIPGEIEINNRLNGHAIDEPKYIDCGRNNIATVERLALEDKSNTRAMQEIGSMIKQCVKGF